MENKERMPCLDGRFVCFIAHGEFLLKLKGRGAIKTVRSSINLGSTLDKQDSVSTSVETPDVRCDGTRESKGINVTVLTHNKQKDRR